MSQDEASPLARTCARCGELTECRTLWHGCGANMGKVMPQLEVVNIRDGVLQHKDGEKAYGIGDGTWHAPTFTDDTGKPLSLQFWTLTVCHACREDWLSALNAWLVAPPAR